MISMAMANNYRMPSIKIYIHGQSTSVCISKLTMPVTRSHTRQERNRIPQILSNTRPVLNPKHSCNPFKQTETLRQTIYATEVFDSTPREFRTSVVDSEEDTCSRESLYQRLSSSALLACLFLAPVLRPEYVEAAGLVLAPEPSNALSLPTWIIHVASVVEWIVAMSLVWRYGADEGREAWRGLAWGMLPLLVGAMCACTWHFFYNSPDLEALVVLQGAMTLLGNCTCWVAAFRIYKKSQNLQ